MTRVLIFLVRLYQAGVSPLLPASCRFTPSCSEYAVQALERFGAVRGGWLAFRRLLRCHPFGGRGPDPVPAADGGSGSPAVSGSRHGSGSPSGEGS